MKGSALKNINRWNYQWKRFKNEEREIFLDWIYPTVLEDYKNKLVLDAGCGNAGYTKIVAKYAKKVVGLDKFSVEAAKANTLCFRNIKIIKGDIEDFNSKTKFDAIYSVGVLHHLGNPERGFENLVRNLKKGGFINIWVYAKEGNWLMVNIIEPLKRQFLLKIPLSVLKVLAYLITTVLYLLVWTIFLLPFNLPYSEYFKKFRRHSYSRNSMNVFDKLNAPQTHWISEEEIKRWLGKLDRVTIRHYNNISWSGFGVKR